MVWTSRSESTSYTTLQNRPKRQLQSANTIRNARYKPLPLKEHRLPLHFAVHNKLSSEVRCLIEEGCNVDARDLYKRTPLMLCCLENDEEWSSGVAMMLLQAGANASLCDSNGRNALMFAVIFSRKKIIDLLLVATDYNIYQRDANRRTALHYALMRGDEKTIHRITDACERQNKASMPKLLEFVQKDIRKYALPRHRTTPPEPCKSIMMAERSNCRIHRSSSDMNVHQFRRGTMRKFVLRSAKRRRSGSVDSVSSSSSSSDGISLISFSRQRSIHSALPYSSHGSTHRTLSEFKSDANSEWKESWKSSVPALWHILTIQCCPSYRRSAKPRFQTFEAALGLPPREPEDDDKDLATVEMVDRNTNDLSPLRRSSMPTPASPPQALFLGRAERRRSEASVDLSAASLAKLFESQQKQTKKLEASKGELRLAKATLDSQVNFRTKTKEDVESTNDDKQTISVEGAPPQRRLSSSKTRSEAPIAKRPSRTSITRNRPGSALRQQSDALQKSTRSNSIPDIKVNNEAEQQKTSVLANTNRLDLVQVKTIPSHQNSVAQESSKTQRTRLDNPADTKETNALNINENEMEISQSSPRRTPRRPSILLRESVLADILEENEAPESRTSNHRVSTGGLRCASAHVRGRAAGGRRHTR